MNQHKKKGVARTQFTGNLFRCFMLFLTKPAMTVTYLLTNQTALIVSISHNTISKWQHNNTDWQQMQTQQAYVTMKYEIMTFILHSFQNDSIRQHRQLHSFRDCCNNCSLNSVPCVIFSLVKWLHTAYKFCLWIHVHCYTSWPAVGWFHKQLI